MDRAGGATTGRPAGLDRRDRAEFERLLGLALVRAGVPAGCQAARLRALARARIGEILSAAECEHRVYAALRTTCPAARRGPAPDVRAAVVLIPALAGNAAAILFLLGTGLTLAEPRRTLGASLRHVGSLAAAAAVLALAAGLAGLLLAAVRRRARAARRRARAAGPACRRELAAAREAWSAALLERGLVPFLQARSVTEE